MQFETTRVNTIVKQRSTYVAFSFARSTSCSYRAALTIAKKAAFYATENDENLHFAGFTRSKEQAAKAFTLAKMIAGWRSTIVYYDGRIITREDNESLYDFKSTLACYLESWAHTDPQRTYCQTCVPAIPQALRDELRGQFNHKGRRYTMAEVLEMIERKDEWAWWHESGQSQVGEKTNWVLPCKRIDSTVIDVLLYNNNIEATPEALDKALRYSKYHVKMCPRFNVAAFKKLFT
jgi:hypothetical protein